MLNSIRNDHKLATVTVGHRMMAMVITAEFLTAAAVELWPILNYFVDMYLAQIYEDHRLPNLLLLSFLTYLRKQTICFLILNTNTIILETF